MGGLFFSQAILPDFIYTEHDVYAILILEVPDSMAAAPELNWFCQNLILGRLLSHNCEFCCFLQSKNGSLATKAKLGKQALACDQYSPTYTIEKSKK